ncbi:sulfotransferase family 2 domain-containing protein [Amaricoccus solimangrovi]|uniref:Sulfotransferase family protein n=1 Tax=Amaricoccus solimangrovi TaxID=2589815 RepID=A0A501WCQ7_9RHOB|nr:sulfotransferase family 2 domain-containing protein [Amaricoccus solimangrovi]TPE47369.1 sulfotransferase family protein [Amaricoccus solimangrovi]
MKPVRSPEPLIDPLSRFVLFTNAKCGGTTLKSWFFTNLDMAGLERRPWRLASAFGPRFAARQLLRGRRLTPRGPALRDGEALRRMTNYYRANYCVPALASGATEDFFRFAVVRDPESRLVSAYLDKFCGEDAGRPWVRAVVDQAGGGEITFARFLDYLARVEDAECNPHWRRQTYVLEGHRIDAWVRLERIAEDFAAIGDRIGRAHLDIFGERMQSAPSARISWEGRPPLTEAPASEIAAWRAENGAFPPKAAFLTDETRARIREIYAADYAALPY